MRGCIDPAQWGTVLGASVSEDDVEAYLSHVRQCAFHAEIEKRSQERVGTLASVVRSTRREGRPVLQRVETAKIQESFDRLAQIRRRTPIKVLSIRVNGAEKARLDLIEENRIVVEVDDGALIGIWKPKESDGEDIYLTRYVLPKPSDIPGGKSKSSVILEGGQAISFEVESKEDSRALITVAYRETKLLRAMQLAIERVKYRLARRLPRVNWEWALKAAAAVFIFVVIAVIATKLMQSRRQPNQIAQHVEQQESQADKNEPAMAAAERRSEMVPQNVNGNPTILPGQKRAQALQPSTRRRRSNSLTANSDFRTVPPTLGVEKIYVGSMFDPQLRQALNNSLQARGVTVVDSEEQADAILRINQTRGKEVRVELITQSHQRLWWMTTKSSDNDKDLAQKIVNDLLDKVERLKPTKARPQQQR